MPYPLPPRPYPRGAERPPIDTASADPQSRDVIEACLRWEAHVDAGRIGVAPPAPQGPGDFGCAGLEAILHGPAPATGARRA